MIDTPPQPSCALSYLLRCFRSISSPRLRMCGVILCPRADRGRRGSHRPCPGRGPGDRPGLALRSIGIESSVPFSSLWSLRLAPSCSIPIGIPRSLDVERALRPPFLCPCVCVRSLPRRAAPWSLLRLPPARTSLCLAPRRSLAGPAARSLVDLRSLPLLRVCARYCSCRLQSTSSAFHCIPLRSTSIIASITSRFRSPAVCFERCSALAPFAPTPSAYAAILAPPPIFPLFHPHIFSFFWLSSFFFRERCSTRGISLALQAAKLYPRFPAYL